MMMKIDVPVINESTTSKNKYFMGPIGGFTFADGSKAVIYSCEICGILTKFNTGYNKHRREKHNEENVAFGWAEGEPEWEELEIKEDLIEVVNRE